MGLILQALAVLAGGLILGRLLANALVPLKRLPWAGVGLAIALGAGLLFFVHAYETGSGLPAATDAAAQASLYEAEHAAAPNANNAFLEWARRAMQADMRRHRGADTYYFEPPAVLQNAELGQWSTYELLPARATSKLAEADWIVFYGVRPTLTSAERRHFGAITQFSSLYALARRSDAR